MERKIKAVKRIWDKYDLIEKGELVPVKQTDNKIVWCSNGSGINHHYWDVNEEDPLGWQLIDEDELLVPKGWRLLEPEEVVLKSDKYINHKLSTDINNYYYIPSKSEGRIVKDITADRYFIRKIDNENPITTNNTYNPRKVTIDNCKVGDKVIPGRDFNQHSQCIFDFGDYQTINEIRDALLYFVSGFTYNLKKFQDLELLLFLEEKQELQTSNNFQTNNNIKNGQAIILPPVDFTITRGQKITGHSVLGSTRKYSITSRPLSYQPSSY